MTRYRDLIQFEPIVTVKVLTEANAIGTAYLRTDFLPPESAATSKELFRRYVDLRITVTIENFDAILIESGQLQQQLWSLAEQAAENEPRSIPIGLYIESLNEVIDLQEDRVNAAVRNRVPEVLLIILYASAVLSALLLGYSTGQTGARNLVAILPLLLVLCALLQLIADLNRPDMRVTKVSQGAMLDLRRSLHNEPPKVQ